MIVASGISYYTTFRLRYVTVGGVGAGVGRVGDGVGGEVGRRVGRGVG